MLGVWNEILVGLQKFRAIAHRRQVLDLLPKDLTRLIVLLPQAKPRTLPRWSPPLARANIEIFFSDESAEFIDFDEGADFVLWRSCRERMGSLPQPARDRLVMDAENPSDSSHPHPF